MMNLLVAVMTSATLLSGVSRAENPVCQTLDESGIFMLSVHHAHSIIRFIEASVRVSRIRPGMTWNQVREILGDRNEGMSGHAFGIIVNYPDVAVFLTLEKNAAYEHEFRVHSCRYYPGLR